MTNRRTPAQRTSAGSTWKPGRARAELLKAIGGAAAVVVVTVLLIFIMKPGDAGSGSSTIPDTSQTVPSTDTAVTQPTASTAATQPPASTTPAQP